MNKSSNHKKSSSDRVLVIYEDTPNPEGFTHLFSHSGFPVECRHEALNVDDAGKFGAIVHLARSAQDLIDLLGDQLAQVRDEEWILIAGDSEDDFHCTVQLTASASSRLRMYIRSLWSRFSVT